LLFSALIAFCIIYCIRGGDTGSSLSSEHRRLNNILYNATESQPPSTILMIHFAKKARWNSLNDRQKNDYGDRKDYYSKTALKLLNWQKLAQGGAWFDADVLQRGLSSQAKVLLVKRDTVIVQLKLADGFTGTELTFDTAE